MLTKSAPLIAIQTLHSLRNLYFISSRLGQIPFSQHTFVYLTCIDILSPFPAQAEAFLQEIRPTDTARIPEHPQQRCLDLYFLNTAEHLAFFLPSTTSENLLVQAATPYLATGNDPRLLEIFEAAHSVMLAVFACPQNQSIVVHHLLNYIENLFAVGLISSAPKILPHMTDTKPRPFHKICRGASFGLPSEHLYELQHHHH